MTKFRILEVARPDGKKRWFVQQRRWFLLPYWSNMFFFSHGGADYGTSCCTLKDAEERLELYVKHDQEKRNSAWWRQKSTVVRIHL